MAKVRCNTCKFYSWYEPCFGKCSCLQHVVCFESWCANYSGRSVAPAEEERHDL